jgi:hypothetical protein
VVKPRQQQRLVKQIQLQNGSGQDDDSSDDELPAAEGEQEDVSSDEEPEGIKTDRMDHDHQSISIDSSEEEDVTIVRPLRNRKRRRSESAEPEIAKRSRTNDHLTIEKLIKKFEEKVVSSIIRR